MQVSISFSGTAAEIRQMFESFDMGRDPAVGIAVDSAVLFMGRLTQSSRSEANMTLISHGGPYRRVGPSMPSAAAPAPERYDWRRYIRHRPFEITTDEET